MSDIVVNGQEVAAQAAFAVQSRIVTTIRKMREAWVDLARDLYEFEQAQMWKDLGHSSFGAWMADPDIEIEPRWGYLLTQMYRELVVNHGASIDELRTVESSKVQVVLPALRRGHVEIEQAIAECQSLSRDDLRGRYHGAGSKPSPQGRTPDNGTSYDPESEPQWAVCSHCGSRYVVERVSL